LARAIFGNPNLIVLDEPNSNLDDAGELALVAAIRRLQARKACVLIITHRNSILQATSKLLLLQDGIVKMFGPTGDVLGALQKQAQEVRGTSRAEGSTALSNIPSSGS
jgi:ATP-binding cassette subfamily C exporter for protease/lipase